MTKFASTYNFIQSFNEYIHKIDYDPQTCYVKFRSFLFEWKMCREKKWL